MSANILKLNGDALLCKVSGDPDLALDLARQAFFFDKGREEVNLKVGDLVLVHREFLITPEARDRPSNKMRPKWYGPFKITEKVSTNAFRLDLPFQLRCHPVFNVSALKKYYKNTIEGREVEPHHQLPIWMVSSISSRIKSCLIVAIDVDSNTWLNG